MTSSKPRIGITTYAPNHERELTLPEQYVESVRRAGGLPLLIPSGEAALEDLLSCFDGWVLSGGGDLNPQCYGVASHPRLYDVDAARDEMELELARRLIKRRLPTLAICRGLQVMNVAFGGTLHPHLPDHYGEAVPHGVPPHQAVAHDVELVAESRLGDLLGSDRVVTYSWHHQAIDRLAPGFRVVARAPDGVIEAVEQPEHPELICVQWHPELSAAEDPAQQRLFDELTRLAQAPRQVRRSVRA
jgi:putative glutamine amidotransferase